MSHIAGNRVQRYSIEGRVFRRIEQNCRFQREVSLINTGTVQVAVLNWRFIHKRLDRTARASRLFRVHDLHDLHIDG